jgi:lysozyme
MFASRVVVDLIKKLEGFKSKAYNDIANNATIGYGYLLHLGPINDNDKLLIWTEEQAEEKLINEIRKIEGSLNKVIFVDINQNQFDALVSWTYNLGVGNLNPHICSWLRELNNRNFDQVPQLMCLWNKALDQNGKLVINEGLNNRRLIEAKLFKGEAI